MRLSDALGALAEAVFRSAPGQEIATAIEGAVAAGALTPAGDTLFVPAVAVPPVAVPASALPPSWRGWLAHGYLPLRVRYCAHQPAQLRTLAGILAALDGLPELDCVPQHLAGRWLASLHLPGARDLRDVLTSGAYPDARQVHGACLTSLARFAAADGALRDAIRSAGLPPPAPFPVAGRYRWAVDGLHELLGTTDMPAALPRYAQHGPAILFCDPKPANFLIPLRVANGTSFPRIDLELMCYETPIALQIVLALFAQPVSFHRPGALTEQLADLRGYAHQAAAVYGIPARQLDAMLAYHLARNFVSAAGTPTRAGLVKARSFARLLACAIELLPFLQPARDSGRLLRGWDRQPG